MPNRLSQSEYDLLDSFIGTVLRRVEAGECDASRGLADIMHPLTAYIDEKGKTEFIPWMTARINEWNANDAHRT